MAHTVDEIEEFIRYLDLLRESGVTNMFGAGPYLRDEFNLTRDQSHRLLSAWMNMDLAIPAPERARQVAASNAL